MRYVRSTLLIVVDSQITLDIYILYDEYNIILATDGENF